MGKNLDALVVHLAGTFMLALCFLPMHGQTAKTGSIAGSVSDPSGARVAGAAVVIVFEATRDKRTFTTDAQGSISIPFLTPGNYDLTVRTPGFKALVLNDFRFTLPR
jgi:hypothetical protein